MAWVWSVFVVFVLLMLAIDLGVFHRKAHDVKLKEALIWSIVWITLALCFNVLIYFAYEGHWHGLGRYNGQVAVDPVDGAQLNGHSAAVKFFTGYVIEKSLSVDNIFVIALIFNYFRIPNKYQHRVLYWGILGALIMRGIFIALGATLIAKFNWILYIFGGILLITAGKLLFSSEDPDPRKSFLVKFAHRYFPFTHDLHGQRFIVSRHELLPQERVHQVGDADGADGESRSTAQPGKKSMAGNSRWVLTPLALTLIVVEGTDLIFAVDSIPAIFAITADPFLVFTSNVFAVLGLRSLYFALASVMDKFYYLKTALAAVLAVVGLKMLTAHWLKELPLLEGNRLSFVTLSLVAIILAAGIVASLVRARSHPDEAAKNSTEPVEQLPDHGTKVVHSGTSRF